MEIDGVNGEDQRDHKVFLGWR